MIVVKLIFQEAFELLQLARRVADLVFEKFSIYDLRKVCDLPKRSSGAFLLKRVFGFRIV